MTDAFHDHFSSVARSYAEVHPSSPPALFDWLASLCATRDCVWDGATGSGQAAVDLARYFRQVIATDASAKQLAEAPARPNIDYRVAQAETSGLASASVDLITVAQTLHSGLSLPAD